MTLLDPSPWPVPDAIHGMCLACECGGIERPCWNCGSYGPFGDVLTVKRLTGEIA